ncbi:hypothetical protein [Bufonid herpesvirus 1]|uniref:hypothetical protein n=1 Tax=Bufonid herpesvirus 1 TaxID=2282206 RepID=UPI000EB6BF64|nr:hypothetical protein [Bufonid herpesvirus 1]AXF48603.1 hypothetical protein [Bufonid herpesvirus 1]
MSLACSLQKRSTAWGRWVPNNSFHPVPNTLHQGWLVPPVASEQKMQVLEEAPYICSRVLEGLVYTQNQNLRDKCLEKVPRMCSCKGIRGIGYCWCTFEHLGKKSAFPPLHSNSTTFFHLLDRSVYIRWSQAHHVGTQSDQPF